MYVCMYVCMYVDYYSKGKDELRILGWGSQGGDPYGGKNLLFYR